MIEMNCGHMDMILGKKPVYRNREGIIVFYPVSASSLTIIKIRRYETNTFTASHCRYLNPAQIIDTIARYQRYRKVFLLMKLLKNLRRRHLRISVKQLNGSAYIINTNK